VSIDVFGKMVLIGTNLLKKHFEGNISWIRDLKENGFSGQSYCNAAYLHSVGY